MTEQPNLPPKRRLLWMEKLHGISDNLGESAGQMKWMRYTLILVALIALTGVGLQAINRYSSQDTSAFESAEQGQESSEKESAPILIEEIIGAADYFGERQTWLPLRNTTLLQAGDRIRTAGQSYVTLHLLGQHWVRLDADTEIKLLAITEPATPEEQGEISLFQKSGQVYYRTGTRSILYNISTPHLSYRFEQGALIGQIFNEGTSSRLRMIVGEGMASWTDQALRLGQGDETTVGEGQTTLLSTRTPVDFFESPWMVANRTADQRLGLPLGRMADLTPPVLQIIEPAAGAILQAQSTLLIGQSEPLARVTVGGLAVELDATGRFQTTVALNSGLNTIQILAEDQSGNLNIVNHNVTFELPALEEPAAENVSEQNSNTSVPVPVSSPSGPTPAPPKLARIQALTAELRPSGQVAVNWTVEDPSVVRFGIAWSKTNTAPSRCSNDSSVFSNSVSANGYAITGLEPGTWTIGVSPEQPGNNQCAGLVTVKVEIK